MLFTLIIQLRNTAHDIRRKVNIHDLKEKNDAQNLMKGKIKKYLCEPWTM